MLLTQVLVEAQHQTFHRTFSDQQEVSFHFLACTILSILFFHKALHPQYLLFRSLKFDLKDLPFHLRSLSNFLLEDPFISFDFPFIFQLDHLTFLVLFSVLEPYQGRQVHLVSFPQLFFWQEFLSKLFKFSWWHHFQT